METLDQWLIRTLQQDQVAYDAIKTDPQNDWVPWTRQAFRTAAITRAFLLHQAWKLKPELRH